MPIKVFFKDRETSFGDKQEKEELKVTSDGNPFPKSFTYLITIDLGRIKNQFRDNLVIQGPVKAGQVPGMACSTGLFHKVKETVLVAIN